MVIFVFMFFNLYISPGVAQIDNIFVMDTSSFYWETTIDQGTNFVIDSNGYYYFLIANQTGNDNLTMYRSVDNGDTWTSKVVCNDTNNEEFDRFSMAIDSDDYFHIVYQTDEVAADQNAYTKYVGFDWSTGIYTTPFILGSKTTAGGTVSRPRGCDISVNYNDDICAVWQFVRDPTDSGAGLYTEGKVYRQQTHLWGDKVEFRYNYASPDNNGYGVAVDSLSNGTFVIMGLWIKQESTKYLDVHYYDYQNDNYGTIWTNTTYNGDNGDIVVTSDDVIYVGVDNGTSVNLRVYDWGLDTWEQEDVAVANVPSAMSDIDMARNYDDTIHIVFSCDNSVVSNDVICGYFGDVGDWSDMQYYVLGSTDENRYPCVPYRNYPRSQLLYNVGMIGIYHNNTNDDINVFEDGTPLFYNESGDIYEEFDDCENTYWLVQKLFSDSIAFTNETCRFNYYSKLMQYGSYIIVNQDDTVVKYGLINNYVGTIDFKPVYDRDYGTCYIKFKRTTESEYNFECEFTVQNSTDPGGIGGWEIDFGKDGYEVGESVTIYYTIPSGYLGDIDLYWNENLYDSWEDILGDGNQKSLKVINYLGTNTQGTCWQVNMDNKSHTDQPSVSWDSMCVGGMTTDMSLWLQNEGQFTCNVNAQEKVKIFGNVDFSNDDLWINVYRDSNYQYLETSFYLGTWNIDNFAFDWYPNNYTVGMEDFYVVIEGNEFVYNLSGGDRIVYVYDIGDDDYDNDTSDADSDDENFYVGVPVSTWKVGVALLIIVICMMIPYLITKKWENVPSLVLGVCGLIIDIYLDLVPIFVAYLLAIIVIVYFVYKMLRS